MLTIFLIRHGETEDNIKSIVMGQNDSPLSKKGAQTAKRFRNYFNSNNVKVDKLYVSDLGRALQTARIINKNIQSSLETTPEFRETNYGIYNGKLRSWVESVCLEYKTDTNYRFPDGESKEEMKKRVIKALSRIEKENRNATILIITHGGPIRAVLSHYKNIDLTSMKEVKLSHEYIAKLTVENGKMISQEQLII